MYKICILYRVRLLQSFSYLQNTCKSVIRPNATNKDDCNSLIWGSCVMCYVLPEDWKIGFTLHFRIFP